MKKTLLLIMIALCSGGVTAQNVNIPNSIFKAYLVGNSSINTNADTEIQVSEANAYGLEINTINLGINDFTGLEAFPYITEFYCGLNSLTSIDISQNTFLTIFECSNNSITSLDVSANVNLEIIQCQSNNLTSLDLSQNSLLTELLCSNNNLTSLDLSQNTSLTELRSVDCGLTSLNVANGNNSNITTFETSNNPALSCIQVDNALYSSGAWTTIDPASSFSTDCSMTASMAGIRYVNINASGANNGSSWTDAYTNLQTALSSGVENDTFFIAQGVYHADVSNREVAFTLYPGFKLYGGFIGNETALSQRDWNAYPTILSGDLLGNDNSNVSFDESSRDDNTYVVVRIEGDGTLIDGLTISDGHANSTDNNYNRGAGIYKNNEVDDLVIKNCTIENNASKFICGIFAEFHTSLNPNVIQTALVDKCIFRQNVSGGGSSFLIASFQGTVNATVSNCLMVENRTELNTATAGYGASAGYFDSRGNSILNANFINCTVVNNVDAETAGNPVASVVATRRYDLSSTLNFVAANNLFYGNTITSANGFEATFGALNGSNCPTSTVLQNNIRPDYSVVGCMPVTTSNGEIDTLGVLLDANYAPMFGSVAINTGDITNVAQYVTGFDLANTPRITDGTIDIGCFEFCTDIVDETVTANGFVLSANQNGATYQWVTCNEPGYTVIQGATSQSFTPTQNGAYACLVTLTCSSIYSECTNITTIGLNDIDFGQLEVYPNPTTNTLHVVNGSGYATIIDVSGKLIFQGKITNEQIDVSTLESGVYLLKIETDQGIAATRFIKK